MQEEISHLLEGLIAAEDPEQRRIFAEAIEELESTELALLLESLPLHERSARWQQIPERTRSMLW